MLTNYLDILQLDLLSTEPEPIEATTLAGRVTRKKNLTGKYSDPLSKKAREEYIQENEIGIESIPLEPEVYLLISSVKFSLL
jgi:hypothetical protein